MTKARSDCRIPRSRCRADLYGPARRNSAGLDLASDDSLKALQQALHESAERAWRAAPMLAVDPDPAAGATPLAVRNPADLRDQVGEVVEATVAQATAAVAAAALYAPAWAATAPTERAALLDRTAALLEARMPALLGLLAREAGKTYANGIAEVREAVDFLRFYAAQARGFDAATHLPLGPMVCISPWNFPLAIFMGQVAAALAAGNPVLAKPAEQTPLVAAQAVGLLWEAGIPRAAVQLLPGRGETVGAALVADARVQGVMFTGSTEVARLLQRSLAGRLTRAGQPVPLIAETGGQNAMIVDSSALVEQVVTDAVASAFDSAGQRCSALRVLCVQDDVADRVIEMLVGAMRECRIGDPAQLAVDVGPVIDAEARDGIERHIEALQARGRRVHRHARDSDGAGARGTYVVPTLIELDDLSELKREVFGPVLHLVRYRRRDLDGLLARINATGYGLTLGVHTRIDETIAAVVEQAHAGNVYVNRNMVGAVVGVQPFGGEGLSGTGPKAGGPLYMVRMLAARPDDVMAHALEATDAAPVARSALAALQSWAGADGRAALAACCARYASLARSGQARVLPGPTGERNVYTLRAREAVLCLADDPADRLVQLAAVLAVGSRAVWPAGSTSDALLATLPLEVREAVVLAQDWCAPTVRFDAVLYHGSTTALPAVSEALARRDGPIVGVRACAPGATDIPLEGLVVERALSVNTAAAGGNASLMTIG